MKYAMVRQCQEVIDTLWKRYGRDISFQEMLQYAAGHDLLLDSPGRVQVRAEDAVNSDSAFFEFMDSVILEVDSDLSVYRSSHVGEDSVFPEQRDVVVSRHFRHFSQAPLEPDFFQIVYIYKGSLPLDFESETVSLAAGEFCILSPLSSYTFSIEDDSAVITILIRRSTFNRIFFPVLQIDSPLALFFNEQLNSPGHTNYLLFYTGDHEYMRFLIRNLAIQNRLEDAYSNTGSISALTLIFVYLLRHYSSTVHYYSTMEQSSFSMILQYLSHNYASLSLHDLASFFHYNETYLSKLIKANTGHNYTELVRSLRLNDAVKYLTGTDLSVEVIAEKLGYGSGDAFARVFREKYGVSPSVYRKQKSHKLN